MSSIPERWDGENQWYFVTVATQPRRPVFAGADACEILLQACRELRQYHAYRLGALVILPDHWHGLICPAYTQGVLIETVVGGIKYNAWKNLTGHDGLTVSPWQSRFLDHRIRNERDFNQHWQYIWHNPVKHGYVEKSEDWRWVFLHTHPFGT